MIITPVTEETFPQAVEIYRDAWKESHKDICSAAFLEERDYEAHVRSCLPGLFLLTDQEPVGIVRVHAGTLSNLYVHPVKQGQGYGKQLLAFAKEKQKTLRLTILSTNIRAIGMYQKQGFRFTGNDKQLRENLWEREMIVTERDNG